MEFASLIRIAKTIPSRGWTEFYIQRIFDKDEWVYCNGPKPCYKSYYTRSDCDITFTTSLLPTVIISIRNELKEQFGYFPVFYIIESQDVSSGSFSRVVVAKFETCADALFIRMLL